ncbi:unnamed protein product, partial [Coregonus sp. 'balchen']
MRRSLAKVAKILIGTWAIMDSPIPLSSLRLLVPPLRLMSAFMWQVSQQRAIKHYGKLEEFVTVVTQTVPELMTDRQRTLLILGLRARVTLGRFSAEHPVSLQTLLYSIKSSQLAQVQAWNRLKLTFAKLTQSLITDPVEREHFVQYLTDSPSSFQVVFLEEFRPDFDKALQELVCDFLTRLEELLTLPDFKQTALLLSAGSSGLDECLQSFSHSEDLQFLLQNYKQCRTLYTNISSSDIPQESDIESDAFPDQLNRTNLDTGVDMRTAHLVAMGSTRDIIGCDETWLVLVFLLPVSCKVVIQCWREFGSLREKLRHQCPHNESMYICPQSGKSFKTSPQYPFQCPHCARSFPESNQLDAHEKSHSVAQTLDCHKCGITFSNLPSLVHHVEAHKRSDLKPSSHLPKKKGLQLPRTHHCHQ